MTREKERIHSPHLFVSPFGGFAHLKNPKPADCVFCCRRQTLIDNHPSCLLTTALTKQKETKRANNAYTTPPPRYLRQDILYGIHRVDIHRLQIEKPIKIRLHTIHFFPPCRFFFFFFFCDYLIRRKTREMTFSTSGYYYTRPGGPFNGTRGFTDHVRTNPVSHPPTLT